MPIFRNILILNSVVTDNFYVLFEDTTRLERRDFVALFSIWSRGSMKKWILDTMYQLASLFIKEPCLLVSLIFSSFFVHKNIFLLEPQPPKDKMRPNNEICDIYIYIYIYYIYIYILGGSQNTPSLLPPRVGEV